MYLGELIGEPQYVGQHHGNDDDDPLSEAVLQEMEAQYGSAGHNNEEEAALTMEQLAKENKQRVEFLCKELKARCHREQIYQDDFLFRMFDVIIYPDGEAGNGFKFWWMSQGHPLVQWIWENFGMQDHKPTVIVPVPGWGTALIYSDEIVQTAVQQIVECAEESGIPIIKPQPAPIVENENGAAIMEGETTEEEDQLAQTTINIDLNGKPKTTTIIEDNAASSPPPLPKVQQNGISTPPPLHTAKPVSPMIKLQKPAMTKKGD